MTQNNYILLLSFLLLIVFGCDSGLSDDLDLSEGYTLEESKVLAKQLDIPDFPFSYSFGNLNAGLEEDYIATLGRVLFYDKNLSSTKEISCGSCHQQSLAFADDEALSLGVDAKLTNRNSMSLGSFRSFGRQYGDSSSANAKGLFWDERSGSVKEQLRETINSPNEMGMELDDIVELLKSKEYYQVLHSKAFSNQEVTEDHILEALETFINSIGSVNTKLETEVIGNLNYITGDSVVGKIGNDLGLKLFVSHCGSCHRSSMEYLDDLSVDINSSVANNGLPNHQDDLGLYSHTKDPQDIGKFKIPGLINVELSAPYMHDGRFASLEEVVEFYNSGIEDNPNLHPLLKQNDAAKRMQLTQEEKTALVDFLRLFTDQNIKTEVKWSSPFI